MLFGWFSVQFSNLVDANGKEIHIIQSIRPSFAPFELALSGHHFLAADSQFLDIDVFLNAELSRAFKKRLITHNYFITLQINKKLKR